ncbi:response regulator, partial [bacterium]|nr:response regulator [bacterium]
MKVLVVEDDAFSLNLIVSMLEKHSIEVEAMGSAKAALEFLERGELVDVIVSDVMMPHMDGFTFVRQLNTDRRLCKISVILCTALNDKASLVKGIEAGIAGYVVKPIKEAVLIPKVKKVAKEHSGLILVVDDEELIRDILVTTLEREGYRVMAAASGKDAIEMLKNN